MGALSAPIAAKSVRSRAKLLIVKVMIAKNDFTRARVSIAQLHSDYQVLLLPAPLKQQCITSWALPHLHHHTAHDGAGPGPSTPMPSWLRRLA